MELLGGGLRSTEAETREVEQFFQSMFGMMHETDLFPAEPQDGAYEVVSVSTIQAQMENLLCASCVFLAWLYCADFLSIPVWSHSWCCWWPHHKHLLQTSKHLWLIGEYLSETVLFFNLLCHLSAAYGENAGVKPPFEVYHQIYYTHMHNALQMMLEF